LRNLVVEIKHFHVGGLKVDQSDEGLTPTKDEGTCLRRLSMFKKEVH